mmetsp:Transcript_98444/g.175333  ORF Transcript_98444/g.175333 Transcript_98444/m.175333 type:complete len:512 (+) Transcript_98444:59-1594(+)
MILWLFFPLLILASSMRPQPTVHEGNGGFSWHEALNWSVVLGMVLLPCSLTLAVYCLGKTPPESKAFKAQETAEPPRLITWFTGVVCVGVLANCTAILPSAGATAKAAGGSLSFSGYMVGAYSLGGLAGLAIFARISVNQLRSAYLLHAACMLLGNASYTYAGVVDNKVLLFAARVIVGLEGGCMYNTTMAIVHFARGTARTPNLIIYQLWLACGVTLGPPLNSASMKVSAMLGQERYADVGVNLAMSIWGAVLGLALLLLFPRRLSTEYPSLIQDSEESVQDDSTRTHTKGIAQQTDDDSKGSSPGSDGHDKAGSQEAGFTTALILIDTASSRMIQRLLWESGTVIVLADYYKWGTANAGLAIGAVGACNAAFQMIFACKIAGHVSDERILLILEMTQVIGVLLMFRPGNSDGPIWPVLFVLGSIIAYCSNQVWGGVSTSFCFKRAMPGTRFCQENLVILNQASLFIGIAFGSTAIRILMEHLHSQNILAACLLFGALHQRLMSCVVSSH